MKPQPVITVESVQTAAEFYCHLLSAERGHGGDAYEQILRGGEMILQIHAFGPDLNHTSLGDAAQPVGNCVVLWFETEDFPALITRMKDHGIQPDREPVENPFARQMECWLHDPDGYQVVIAGPSAYPRQPVKA